MKIYVLTLFPNMFLNVFDSILGRAIKEKKVEIKIIDIRKFSKDKHKKCDDVPYGGGAGMIMTIQPLYDAIKSVFTENSKIIYLSPKGKTYNQTLAVDLSNEKELILICGHYEGIDERIIDIFNPIQISIGDYILTGGEIPALVIIDSVVRNIEGVISKSSLEEESFSKGLLEYPQYTRPRTFEGYSVPEVLLSGNHEEIKKWREKKAVEQTKLLREDLITKCKK